MMSARKTSSPAPLPRTVVMRRQKGKETAFATLDVGEDFLFKGKRLYKLNSRTGTDYKTGKDFLFAAQDLVHEV